tara:strand:+ start:305 stop:754 length:450 start_codon:yes stop_codon:yes gene_type:complete
MLLAVEDRGHHGIATSANSSYRYRMKKIDGPDRALWNAMDPVKRDWLGAFAAAALKNMGAEKLAPDMLAIGDEIVALSLEEDIATKELGENVIRMLTTPYHFLDNALQHYLAGKEGLTKEQLLDLRVATLTAFHNAVGWPHDGLPANDS